MGVQRKVVIEDQAKQEPKKIMLPGVQGPQGPAAKFYKAKSGFANYWFNEHERDRLLTDFRKQGDFRPLAGDWSVDGVVRLKKLRAESKVKLDIVDKKDGGSVRTLVKLSIDAFPYELDPLKSPQEPEVLKMPETSGGLLSALYLYRQLLSQGATGFGEFYHGGHEPLYPPAPEDAKLPGGLSATRVETEVIHSRLGPYLARWYFARADQKLIGLEVRLQDNEDPCEVFFGDYRAVEGRMLPHRLQVVYGNGHYGTFTFTNFRLAAK
jgi:hypothetical protein